MSFRTALNFSRKEQYDKPFADGRIMPPYLLSFLRRRIWTLTAGAVLAAAALWLLGPRGLWALLLLGLAAGLFERFLVPREQFGGEPERRADDQIGRAHV